MGKKKLVILDRDGVVNELVTPYVTRIQDFSYISGSVIALRKLTMLEKGIAMCSNQRGVALGYFSELLLSKIETKISSDIGISKNTISFEYCLHDKSEGCNCRKPAPGMLIKCLEDREIPSRDAVFVGDNLTDYLAAKKAGVDFALVLTGHGVESSRLIPKQIPRFRNLLEFVNALY